MKTIGLLGGMSWESTVGYYQVINKGIKESLGGLHSAKIAMYSVDFDPIEKLQHSGDCEGTAEILIDARGMSKLQVQMFYLYVQIQCIKSPLK
jgi:aspartate racemase